MKDQAIILCLWLTVVVSWIAGPVNCQCRKGEVRLANSTASHAGRVEVCVNQDWGSVCDDLWDMRDATVLCRQLGLPADGAIAVSFGYYGGATGPIVMDNVECDGTEASITECNHTSNHNCKHTEDAGVICKAPCANGNVRLVNGSDNTQGKIEVCVDQMWTDVCDKNWSISDADVVCRQLGYSGNGSVPTKPGYYGQQLRPIVLGNLECTGQEERLVDCRVMNTRTYVRDCNHTDDVGVICNQNQGNESTTTEFTTQPLSTTSSPTSSPTFSTTSSSTFSSTQQSTTNNPISHNQSSCVGSTPFVVGQQPHVVVIVLAILVGLLLLILAAMTILSVWLVVKLKKSKPKSRVDPNVYEERHVDNPIYGSTEESNQYSLLGPSGVEPDSEEHIYETYQVPPSGN